LTHDILFCFGALNKAEQPNKTQLEDTFDVFFPEQAPASVLSGGYPYNIPSLSSLPQLEENSRQTLRLSPCYFGSTESGEQQEEASSAQLPIPTCSFPISSHLPPNEINMITTGGNGHHLIPRFSPSSEVHFAELYSTETNSHLDSSWLASTPTVAFCDSSITPLVIETNGTEESIAYLWSMFH
jgi:hypothetical protein